MPCCFYDVRESFQCYTSPWPKFSYARAFRLEIEVPSTTLELRLAECCPSVDCRAIGIAKGETTNCCSHPLLCPSQKRIRHFLEAYTQRIFTSFLYYACSSVFILDLAQMAGLVARQRMEN